MFRKARFVVVVTLMCLVAVALKADVLDDFATALRSGNARNVARYFSDVVELKTADKSNSYSRNQAELVLKEFFDNYPLKSFSLAHKGTSEQMAQYAIGTLETSRGSFRAYVLMRNVNGKMYVQELTFERQ